MPHYAELYENTIMRFADFVFLFEKPLKVVRFYATSTKATQHRYMENGKYQQKFENISTDNNIFVVRSIQ